MYQLWLKFNVVASERAVGTEQARDWALHSTTTEIWNRLQVLHPPLLFSSLLVESSYDGFVSSYLQELASAWCIRMLTWHQREEGSRVGRTESELNALNEICLELTQLLLCRRESVLGIVMHWNEKCLAAFIRQRKDRTLSTECAIWEITDQIIQKESNS